MRQVLPDIIPAGERQPTPNLAPGDGFSNMTRWYGGLVRHSHYFVRRPVRVVLNSQIVLRNTYLVSSFSFLLDHSGQYLHTLYH